MKVKKKGKCLVNPVFFPIFVPIQTKTYKYDKEIISDADPAGSRIR